MNNFDTSSSGVNLDLNCFFDTNQSQHDFDENFIRIDTDGSSAFNDRYFNVDTFLFIDYGNADQDNYNKSKTVSIRGYSQGDYAEIIIPTNLGFKRGFDFKSYFTNLFYDAPIYAKLDIDDNEFCFDEYLTDQYRYDKDEFLAIAEKHIKHNKKAVIIEWLTANLPENLEYV